MTVDAPALERTFALVEQKIGRKLREAERAIDVLRLDSALNRAKDELEHAIRMEMQTATARWLRYDRLGTPQLRVTQAMRKPLQDLHRLGIHEASLELNRLGYTDTKPPDGRRRPRRYATYPGAPDPQPVGDGLDETYATIERGLPGIAVRIVDELVEADFTNPAAAALAQALLNLPGARDIASRVVSTALTSGLAQTFEQNQGLVTGWEYTAVLDSGTCDVCAPLDGTTYPTLDDLFEVLPNFGPNPDCDGGGRCRCRAVPSPA